VAILDVTKKTMRAAAIALTIYAIYRHAYSPFFLAYVTQESSMIVSNTQEIYENIATAISVTLSVSMCNKQLFKDAPLLQSVNWMLKPYLNVEERIQKFIYQRIRNRYGIL
jgi:hypothetical protein